MANELLTKDDIIRGKKNFNALNSFLSSSDSTVDLPNGQKIKTREAIVKEFNSAHQGTGAAYPVDNGVDSLVLNKQFGVDNTGWGATTGDRIPSSALHQISKAGLYSFSIEESRDLLDLPEDWGEDAGTLLVVPYTSYNRTQFLFRRARGASPNVYLRSVSHDGENAYWSRLYHSGETSTYTTTTATSANVVVTSTGELQRSTSSRIFKTDIKDIEMPDYRVALKAVRPVSYRSTSATADRTDWSWYSFVAEDLAKIDPRLVQMSNVEFFEDTDEDGNTFINSRELPEGEYVPSGLNLNGIVTLMARINQYMLDDIEALEGEKTQLKTRMTKLEKRLEALEAAKQS